MAQEQARQLLQQGIAAAQAGQNEAARQVLQQVVRLDPQNEMAWLWLSSVARDNKERLFCLKQLLAVNPQNEHAIKGLQRLGVEPEARVSNAPSSPIPTVNEEKMARLQQATDEFLRRFNPEPVDHLRIEWTRKQRRRYGESGARRLQRILYAAAAVLVMAVVGVLVLVAANVDILGSDGQGSAALATWIPTVTPTQTLIPTLGGATPTPFPEQMAVPVTEMPPANWSPGDPYRLITPTVIYPRVDSSLIRIFEKGINYHANGDYAEAIEIFAAERENSKHCRPIVYYYEALSLAEQGNYALAKERLQEAQDFQPDPGFESCQGSPLIPAALGYVWYLEDSRSQTALNYANQALSMDPKFVIASVIKAGVHLANGQIPEARSTITQALLEWPADTNLLEMAAKIEISDGQFQAALNHLGRALYVDPALHPALVLQAETYLRLGDGAQAGTEAEVEYYGLAVLSAQTLLLYYPGDSLGYLLLAQGRVGEGNYAMAETALTRIIAVEDSLPSEAVPVVREAYRMLGEVQYAYGRDEDLEQAQQAFQHVLITDRGIDPVVAERLYDIALRLRDYPEARSQLEALLSVEPGNRTWQLQRTRMQVEICTLYSTGVPCDYDGMLRLLGDEFINSLPDEMQRADGYSYRAQARYQDTRSRGDNLSEADRHLAYGLALNDVTQALAMRDSAVDHYYRGLILEALAEPVKALEEYQWVQYWDALYAYPFSNAEFDRRLANLAEQVGELVVEPTGEASSTGATATPVSNQPVPTATPAFTATPGLPPAAPELP
ncbi:MAG: tetratricopeptide repeat protein [Anaerolineae bacterium]|nr:tetratricopeptide repeat protein [Anaerolineae bacterium]